MTRNANEHEMRKCEGYELRIDTNVRITNTLIR
jgi:hypothetical protein